MAINVEDTVVPTKPNQPLTGFQFPKGLSERLRQWREAVSQAGLVGGRSYTTMRAKTHYFAIHVYVCLYNDNDSHNS